MKSLAVLPVSESLKFDPITPSMFEYLSVPRPPARATVVTDALCTSVKVMAAVALEKSIMSSLPAPPSMVSLLVPPRTVSLPAPPFSSSVWLPPSSVSLPAPPNSRSRPSPPNSMSLPAVPVMISVFPFASR